MRIDLSDNDYRFRDEVRTFLDENLTEDLRRAGQLCSGIYSDRPIAEEWLKILNKKGWAVPTWPEEYGGTGWTLSQLHIFAEELALAFAPPITPNALRMVGPTIIAFGTDEQKRQYLPPIRSGDDWWAQGYSEPEAGSDLAALKCNAVCDGDDFIINGTKIWTTHAHWSNKIFCLVRTKTDGKPQQGISFLLFDLDVPGIQIRPIISISGDHELNQIFFDNVRVPVSSLLGGENEGWTVAKQLLTFERGNPYSAFLKAELMGLKRLAASESNGCGAYLDSSGEFARKISDTEIAIDALHFTELRILSALEAGEGTGTASSMLKIRGTELRQRISELRAEAAHLYAAPLQTACPMGLSDLAPVGTLQNVTAMPKYLNDRAASIYAGSNEIQRNIIAARVLGL